MYLRLFLLLLIAGNISAQKSLNEFKDELPEIIYTEPGFLENSNEEVIADLNLSYRLVFHKIKAMDESYTNPDPGKQRPVEARERYTSLKNYFLDERNIYYTKLADSPKLEGYSDKDEMSDDILAFRLKNVELGKDVSGFTREEKEYAARFINSDAFEKGIEPEKIIHDYYTEVHNKFNQELDSYISDQLPFRRSFHKELLGCSAVYQFAKTDVELLEILNKFYRAIDNPLNNAEYYLGFGIFSGAYGTYSDLEYGIDGQIDGLVAGQIKPVAMVEFTIGKSFKISDSRKIFNYVNTSLNLGFSLLNDTKKELRFYKKSEILGTDNYTDIYTMDGANVEDVYSFNSILDVTTPIYIYKSDFFVEIGLRGFVYYYIFNLDGKTRYTRIKNENSYTIDKKYDITGTYFNMDFSISPMINFMLPVTNNAIMDLNFSTKNLGLRLYYKY